MSSLNSRGQILGGGDRRPVVGDGGLGIGVVCHFDGENRVFVCFPFIVQITFFF